MRAVILLNGEPYRGKIDVKDAYVICCDGAYNWAKGRVRIDENVGDFDSVVGTPDPPPSKIYPSEKDMTDGEIALDRAVSLSPEEILIFGGGGRREDHFLGNLHLLYRAAKAGVRATMVNNDSQISLLGEGEYRFAAKSGQTVSLLPFGGDAHIMEMRGLKYAEEDLWLKTGSTRGISNLAEGEECSFRVKEGFLLVIFNREII